MSIWCRAWVAERTKAPVPGTGVSGHGFEPGLEPVDFGVFENWNFGACGAKLFI